MNYLPSNKKPYSGRISNVSALLYDSNVWVALTFSAQPHHTCAVETFGGASNESPASFCRVTQQSFLSLATTPALLREYRADGFTNRDAVNLHATLIHLSNVQILHEPPDLEILWHQFAALPTASPKVWMDAYLAAFAIGHKIELVTFDSDFKRFIKDGLRLKLLTPLSRTNYTNPIDLYCQGCAILAGHLGPVDSIRFLRLLDKGSGDYTATHQNQPDEGTMPELCTEIRALEATQAKP